MHLVRNPLPGPDDRGGLTAAEGDGRPAGEGAIDPTPEPAPARRRVVVLACGEPARGDDAAALRAIERLPAAALEAAEIRHCRTLGPDDLVEVGPDEVCLLVDAAVGITPGLVVRGPLESLARQAPRPAIPRSSHLVPVEEALGLAAILRPGLPAGSFVAIGGVSFGLGERLSAPVEAALPAFVEAIAAEIERLARPAQGAA